MCLEGGGCLQVSFACACAHCEGILLLQESSRGSSGVMVCVYCHGRRKSQGLALKPPAACSLPRQNKSYRGDYAVVWPVSSGSTREYYSPTCHSTNHHLEWKARLGFYIVTRDVIFFLACITVVSSSLAVNFNLSIIYCSWRGANLGLIIFSLDADIWGRNGIIAYTLWGLPTIDLLLYP